MHAHLTTVFSMLDESMAAVQASAESVPLTLRGRRPAPERWSVAEVLEHLMLVDRLFTERIGGRIAAVRAGLGSEGSERTPLPPQIAAMMASRARTRNAPEQVIPTGNVDAVAALAALQQAHAGFRAALRDGNGLALSSVTYDHPFFGTLNVYQWAELMAGHERRHAEQIAEIREQLRALGV
jgi:hypothetical protein